MYQALYRKYRPNTLEDVVGQDIIIKILSNSIVNNKISHAYLFCGPRGTGKTSIAKIMAKIVNCEHLNGIMPCDKCDSCKEFNNKNNTDIIEIDAASNNGVDEIRELKNKINLVPTIGKYKVYIIDEVHMLTIGAFNALLKTLEEPPSHALFILATTEPHKIPITILSRCQRLDFKRISNNSIVERLKQICANENIKYEENALLQIANLCDGGMRDSISMLDKLVAYTNNNIQYNDVNEINGLLTDDQIDAFLSIISENKYKEMFEILDKFNNDGKNFTKLIDEIVLYLRNMLVNSIENKEKINMKYTFDQMIKYIDMFNNIISELKLSSSPQIVIETNLIKTMMPKVNSNNNQESKLEKRTINVDTYQIDNNSSVKIQLSDDFLRKIDILKQFRVENTLSKFNKKKLLEIKKKIENISSLLIDPDSSALAGLLLDGELKAASDESLIFVYESDNVAIDFNSKLDEIEKILEKINVNMKVIAVSLEDWNKIKQEFNSKTKKYVYKADEAIFKEIFDKKEKNKENNSIESMFNDIIRYD